MEIDQWIALSVKHNASDLHLCSGHFPLLRINGELYPVEGAEKLSATALEQLGLTLLTPTQQQALQQQGQIDLALTRPEGIRLRANFFYQQKGLSVALRPLAQHCPTLETLAAPEIVTQLTLRHHGLILVTGATGSGKSTTLAAMINHLNQHCRRHIITLEDPIELLHHSANSLIQQRELGRDTHSFSDALRAALRQDPDVILLGELRDSETIRLALTAAETGHLVLATLHTRTAPQAVDRLVDVFSAEEKGYIRSQLASSLQGVIAQRLVPRAEGGRQHGSTGRVALFEILVTTSAVSNLIREGKSYQLPSVLQTGAHIGMQTFAQSLQQRQAQGWVTQDQQTALYSA